MTDEIQGGQETNQQASPDQGAVATEVAPSNDGTTVPPANPSPVGLNPVQSTDISMLGDVELTVTAELGRTKLTIGEITGLTSGSIVTLGKAAGEPADLRINDQLFATAEVIVMDGFFAVKITKLLSKEERLRSFT